jgi:hypothetical protein
VRTGQRRLILGAALVVVVVAAIGLVVGQRGNAHPSDAGASPGVTTKRSGRPVATTTTSLPSAPTTTSPPSVSRCGVHGGTPLPGFVGLTRKQATELARADGDDLLVARPQRGCRTPLRFLTGSPVEIVLGRDNRVEAAACEFGPGTVCGHKPPQGGGALARLLSDFGWSDLTVGAQRTTYGQAHRQYPDLAASATIPPGQAVWVVTTYYPHAQPGRASRSWGPPGHRRTPPTRVWNGTAVINAATEVETDYCLGCAFIPPADPATTTLPATTAKTRPGHIGATLVLPATTIKVGRYIDGSILVDNETGQAIHVGACGEIFQVDLANQHVVPNPAWTTCAHIFTIPAGPSAWPISVGTTYDQCGFTGTPRCVHDRIPDLPTGTYEATTYEAGSTIPVPAPQTIDVIR